MNASARLLSLLSTAGCPAMHGYLGPMGSGHLTFRSQDAARKASELLGHAFKIRGPQAAREYAKKNKGTCLLPTTYPVWCVGIYPKA